MLWVPCRDREWPSVPGPVSIAVAASPIPQPVGTWAPLFRTPKLRDSAEDWHEPLVAVIVGLENGCRRRMLNPATDDCSPVSGHQGAIGSEGVSAASV